MAFIADSSWNARRWLAGKWTRFVDLTGNFSLKFDRNSVEKVGIIRCCQQHFGTFAAGATWCRCGISRRFKCSANFLLRGKYRLELPSVDSSRNVLQLCGCRTIEAPSSDFEASLPLNCSPNQLETKRLWIEQVKGYLTICLFIKFDK